MTEEKRLPLWAHFAAGGTASMWAEVCTLPVDTAKVRLQNQMGSAKPKYKGFLGTAMTIAREEGTLALWKGCAPGLLRQAIYATLRIGLYEPVRDLYSQGEGDSSLATKVAAGLTTGAIAITVAQPADLVKIRLQSEGKLEAGAKRRYHGTMDAFAKISRSEGVGGLWKGLGPNVLRNSIINAAELASYDQIKQSILKAGLMTDNVPCHLTSGFLAGFCATVVGSPFDVVKTRVMNSPLNAQGEAVYKSTVHCFGKMLREEGFMAFYKGFVPNFTRIGSWNTVMFLTLEQVRRLFREHLSE